MSGARSEALFAEALRSMPGGVNSPVRAFRAVGGRPFFVERAQGARLWDVDGRELLDYVGTWGPAILGHAHPKIVAAVQAAAARGTSFGIPNPLEVAMARRLTGAVPGLQKVRLCNSGTEACLSAVRLARGFTGRDLIVKFAGCYHGHADSLLVKAGSGALTFGHPDSAGVPAELARHTLVLPFNDAEAARAAFAAHGRQIAAVILELVPANAGLYLPRPGYLETLRHLTAEHGALLIADEVMTGFRVGWTGAQGRLGVTADLTCLGKIIGGGLPVGALGGRADIMDWLAPLGPVYQAGTLSGNPLAMAAGLAALDELRPAASGEGQGPKAEGGRPRAEVGGQKSEVGSQRAAGDAYARLEALGAQLEAGMRQAAGAAGVPVQFQRLGSMFCAYFTDQPVHNLADALRTDRSRFARFFHGMLAEGIYLAPSPFEAGFLSTAHTEADIERTVAAAAKVLRTL